MNYFDWLVTHYPQYQHSIDYRVMQLIPTFVIIYLIWNTNTDTLRYLFLIKCSFGSEKYSCMCLSVCQSVYIYIFSLGLELHCLYLTMVIDSINIYIGVRNIFANKKTQWLTCLGLISEWLHISPVLTPEKSAFYANSNQMHVYDFTLVHGRTLKSKHK